MSLRMCCWMLRSTAVVRNRVPSLCPSTFRQLPVNYCLSENLRTWTADGILSRSRFLHEPTKTSFVVHRSDKPSSTDQIVKPSSTDQIGKPSSTDQIGKPPIDEPPPSLWKRFKQMYKEYWYVLVPVHIVTSLAWFGGFYYAARSGIDIVPLLEYMGASERITKPLQDSGAGYVAIAYAMYKIATPARYMVTLGGTTVSITYLRQLGIIKPVPTSEQFKTMIRVKRAAYQEKKRIKKAAKLKKKELHKPFKRPEG